MKLKNTEDTWEAEIVQDNFVGFMLSDLGFPRRKSKESKRRVRQPFQWRETSRISWRIWGEAWKWWL